MDKDLRQYLITIPYRESVYEVHRGRPRKRPYLASFKVTAKTKEVSIQRALELFKGTAWNSSVGWRRFPIHKDITVEEL